MAKSLSKEVITDEQQDPKVKTLVDEEPTTPEAEKSLRVAKKPNARAWFLAAVGGIILLAGLVGFIAGGLTAELRASRHQGPTREQSGIGFMMVRSGHMTAAPRQQVADNTASITDVSDSSIAVKYVNGASVTYSIDGSTRILNSDDSSATVSDLKSGDSVIIRAGGASTQRVAFLIAKTQ